MGLPVNKRLSYKQYLDLERSTGIRHEWSDGIAVAMSGGAPRHSRLCLKIGARLEMGLQSSSCETYESNLKIMIPTTRQAKYADVTVVCGPLVRDDEDPLAVTNPTVLFEVLSPSTERYDRGDKFAAYQQITSLKHYVLVTTGWSRIELYTRIGDDSWTLRIHGAGDVLDIPAIGVSIPLDALYAGLPEESGSVSDQSA